MKKFLLALLAIVFAIPFANAADAVLHLEGTNHGWSSGSNLTFNHVEGTSIYTLDNVNVEGEFLICGPSYSPKYGKDQSDIDFGTNTLKENGGNLTLKQALYDVNLTFDTSSYKLTIVKNVYLRGVFNDWDTTTKFNTEDGKTYTLFVEELKSDFLIASSDWDKNNNCKFGGVEIKSSTDLNVAKSLSYQSYGGSITLYQTLKNVTITFKWTPNSKDGATVTFAVPYDKVYLYGNLNGKDNWTSDNSDDNRIILTPNEDKTLFSKAVTIESGSGQTNAFFHIKGVCGDDNRTEFYPNSTSNVNPESGKNYQFTTKNTSKAYEVAPGTYFITVSLEPGATTGTIYFATKLYIYGDVVDDDGDGKIALSVANNTHDPNTSLDGSFEGTFTFEKPTSNSPMRRDTGDDNCSFKFVDDAGIEYGSSDGTTLGFVEDITDWKNYTPATLSFGDDVKAFSIPSGEHKIVVNMLTGAIYATSKSDVATGVADVEVSEDALVNVYNYSGVMIRKGVKASEATLDLPKGLYIVGNKKMIVK